MKYQAQNPIIKFNNYFVRQVRALPEYPKILLTKHYLNLNTILDEKSRILL